MKLADVRAKAQAKRDELGKVFEEAKTDDGQYDFNKVTVLGAGVKGSVAVAEAVKAMTAELDELCAQAETLEEAERAAKGFESREKGGRGFALPGGEGGLGGRGNYPNEKDRFRALGEMVREAKAFKDWHGKGRNEGITLQFDDMLPSEMLAMASVAETIGSKALMATTAGYAPERIRLPGFVEAATRPIQLLDIIPMARTGRDAVTYMEETTRTHAAAERAESAAFAESTFAFTERTSAVRKITDSLPVTDEQLEDVELIESYINGRLAFGIRQRLDSQCLVGDGTAPNLRGLKNTVGIQTQARAVDPIPDAFFKAMTKIRLVGRAIPTHHVMHPSDWEKVRLLRTVDGVYIWGSPSEAGPERLWGLPVVQCDADAAATGYVGSFDPAWVSLFERRGVEIAVGYVGTQFTSGQRTVRGDMRAALVFMRPAAFCSVTGL